MELSNSNEAEVRARTSRFEELLKDKQNAATGSEEKKRVEKQIAELKMELASPGVIGGVPGGVGGGVIGGVIGGVPGGVEILERQRADGVNAILQSIRTERLAHPRAREVLNRLPVHVGDPVSDDAVKRIGEVLARSMSISFCGWTSTRLATYP